MAREVNQLLGRVFAQRRKDGRTDLEAVESALRTALHQAGAATLSQLLQFEAPAAEQRQLPCPCGDYARYQEIRSKPLLTMVGPVRLSRPYYLCSQCHVGQFPVDVELDIENTEFSPGVRRMHALVGQQAPFDHGREQMQLLAGLAVTTKLVERIAEAIGADIAQREQEEIQKALQLDLPVTVGEPIPVLYIQMDGTGVPVVKKETVVRQGKSDGQPAHTREVKLGCVFRQTTWDEEGFAIRDPDSTTYTGAIETAVEFGKRIYREALQRGWSRAKKKVVIGDGAEWIWNLVAEHFPGAREIVDLYHARQHLWAIARQLYPQEEVQQKAWMKVHQKRLLDKGKIEKLVSELHSIAIANPQLAEKIRTQADYFERNAERMRYPRFRRQHLFVGSGVIEAGCKTVVGSRLKQSGMFWTVRGANAILALRCSHLNGQFEDYWEQRRDARAA
ncbi:MAG TPA: ISKra4 family transposase [Terriglobales bacterium]|nr:ISKra4 family transposase [Terriglobales bacterium]